MERVVYSSLGRPSGRTKVGPGRGLDNAVLSLGGGRVMVVTIDPVSVIPALGMELSAWLSVHLIASDLTASGVDPEFATFGYNFPGEMTPSDKEAYIRSVGEECRKLGVDVVGGNTGTYPGGGFTVIGAGTMFGLGREGGYVTPAMARVGDRVFVTKQAAMEAAASLAWSFPGFVSREAGEEAAEEARRMVRGCSTVVDARAARKVGLGRGGVTSMHDATEGGVLGALDEMASASGKAFEVDPTKIPVSEAAARVCAAFGIDPLRTMSEGSLLVTCARERGDELRRAVKRSGIQMAEIGWVKAGEGVVVSGGGRPKRLRPVSDGYWGAYGRAIAEGLS